MMLQHSHMTRLVPIAFMIAALALPATSADEQNRGEDPSFGIVIHGGGGVRDEGEMTPDLERQYREALTRSVSAGSDVLRNGGTSVAAVEAAIRVMEDSPLFNAGKGASFNRAGFNELDSAIMDGGTSKAAGVAAVRHVKNPISLARLVMERSPHVLMVGEGAENFALEQGMPLVPASYFFTERKWQSLRRRLDQGTEYGKSSALQAEDAGTFGTVGAVALDMKGNLAAGTSTGGREGKLPGRVGDSPIVGAGTYANNRTLAVSSTGLGEYVMRVVAAKEMSDLMEMTGVPVEEATERVRRKIEEMGGSIGVVAIDAKGRIAMPFSGDGMYRGYARNGGAVTVKIYRE
jgi:L-asparaginase / beta-aspartyl-peptidase